MYIQQRTFCPVEKLPSPFFEAVNHVCQRTDARPEVVVPDTFAVSSMLTQRRYKVRSLNGSLMATSLNTLSLSPTVTGKGESYKALFQPNTNSASGVMELPASGITIDDLILQDVSVSALMSELAGYSRSASIQLEDGYSFLGGPLMKREAISKLPQLWSGPPSLKVGRHHGKKDALEPCLAIGLRMQPDLFYSFLKRDKGESRNLGLWPRFLTFCYDPERFPVAHRYAARSSLMMSDLLLMERFQALLPTADAMQERDQPPRKVLVMDTYANALLREIAYWIKGQMYGEFHDIQDAAGRAAENTLRLASNFHVVCQGEGLISREMIERAWAFVEWSLGQFRNVFVHALQPPPKPAMLKQSAQPNLPAHQQRLNADMQFVLETIAVRSNEYPMGKVPQAEVALLTGFPKVRFHKTLGWLVAGRLVELEGGNDNGTIRLLRLQHFNAPYGNLPTALLR